MTNLEEDRKNYREILWLIFHRATCKVTPRFYCKQEQEETKILGRVKKNLNLIFVTLPAKSIIPKFV